VAILEMFDCGCESSNTVLASIVLSFLACGLYGSWIKISHLEADVSMWKCAFTPWDVNQSSDPHAVRTLAYFLAYFWQLLQSIIGFLWICQANRIRTRTFALCLLLGWACILTCDIWTVGRTIQYFSVDYTGKHGDQYGTFYSFLECIILLTHTYIYLACIFDVCALTFVPKRSVNFRIPQKAYTTQNTPNTWQRSTKYEWANLEKILLDDKKVKEDPRTEIVDTDDPLPNPKPFGFNAYEPSIGGSAYDYE